MSYDLFFKRGKRALDRAAFERYFGERRWWTVRSTETGAQAWYENEDTGVYFSFSWTDDEVALNVNYFRPHVFGLEAAPEVAAFVRAFEPTISDPQSEGMGEGPFSEQGFLRGWNAGNHFAHRAIIAQHSPGELEQMPAERLEALWRWNFNRNRVQERLSEVEMISCFVPKISLVRVDDAVRTIVVWDGEIDVLLPPVDEVLTMRRDRDAPVLAPRAALEATLESYPLHPTNDSWGLALPAREIVFENQRPPAALGQAIARTGRTFEGEGFAWDQVHTREVVAPR